MDSVTFTNPAMSAEWDATSSSDVVKLRKMAEMAALHAIADGVQDVVALQEASLAAQLKAWPAKDEVAFADTYRQAFEDVFVANVAGNVIIVK